jgi:DNA polymerase-1
MHTSEAEVMAELTKSIEALKDKFKTEEVIIALSDRKNFRKELNPEYKANRANTRKPMGLGVAQDFFKTKYLAVIWPTLEADDVLGIMATQSFDEDTIIVSDDKDLQTIAGYHYNKGEVIEVSEQQALKNFYTQVLTGDTADNYKGCRGVGPVKAERILAGCRTSLDMWQAVLGAYAKAEQPSEDALMNARMAYLLRAGDVNVSFGNVKLWEPPLTADEGYTKEMAHGS